MQQRTSNAGFEEVLAPVERTPPRSQRREERVYLIDPSPAPRRTAASGPRLKRSHVPSVAPLRLLPVPR